MSAAQPPGPIDVVHYAVSIAVDFQTREIEGHSEITLRARTAGQQRLTFSATHLQIDSVRFNGTALQASATDSGLVVDLPRPLSIGQRATLAFAYHGRPARGLVFNGPTVYASYFTCDWMVCQLDDFGEKAAIDLTLRVPQGMTAYGPGTLTRRSRLPDGAERQVWSEARPYSAYLYGFALGAFTRASAQAGATELVYLSPDADAERLGTLFAPTGDMLAFLQDKAGVPFPHRRYVQVHTPGSDAQEASNYSVVGEKVVAPRLDDPQEDWALVHELAHQWWGNAVTCTDLSQFWLNEGITTFMVAAWKEHRWGRLAYERELASIRNRFDAVAATGGDHPLTYSGPYPSLSARRAVQYSKGALFMDRLRQELGDGPFWAALKSYTRQHAGGVVNSLDLQRSLEQSSRKDLSRLFEEWVY